MKLDTYLDALEDFPKNADTLKTEVGVAQLVKTDIFKGILYYIYKSVNGKPGGSGKFYPLSIERVKLIKEMNEDGELPADLQDMEELIAEENQKMDFDEDLTGFIELPPEERKRRRRRRNRNRGKQKDTKATPAKKATTEKPKAEQKPTGENKPSRSRRRPNRRRNKGNKNDTKK